jgi:hypothetical protein
VTHNSDCTTLSKESRAKSEKIREYQGMDSAVCKCGHYVAAVFRKASCSVQVGQKGQLLRSSRSERPVDQASPGR